MENNINILILSCGTRNKIVQYFKKELKGKGKVYTTDCSVLAPALYEADKHFIVPPMYDPNYLDTILNICKENNIKAVLTLIDPEISLLAKYKNEFLAVGVMPIVSNFEIVELCYDKYKMYEFLVQNNFRTIKSYINKEMFYRDIELGNINYPVFVKPVKGSASINISKVTTKEEVEILFNRFDNLMIQEFMDGREFGVDVYVDMFSKEPVSIFIKEKLKMRAGETDKSVSVKDPNLFKLIETFVNKVGLQGINDIDIFKINEEYYISEVNPRFGGGYPHAYECGVNIPRAIINNICKKTNIKDIAKYESEIFMTKYSEVKVFK